MADAIRARARPAIFERQGEEDLFGTSRLARHARCRA